MTKFLRSCLVATLAARVAQSMHLGGAMNAIEHQVAHV